MTTSADIHSITFGTGHSIFTSTLLPAILSAKHEILFVTCFWAASATLSDLNSTLLKLSETSIQNNSNHANRRKVTFKIGFSSSSLTQKLFHPQSAEGKTYSATEVATKLGLPNPDDLPGLEIEVKSQFFLPFSVWHPKFVVIDRTRVFLPSCNVSWEDWFEGCIELSGPIVKEFANFWEEHWGFLDDIPHLREVEVESAMLENVPCKFLPSPHHRNPNFRLPWQDAAPPPATPLNTQLLELFANAQVEIYIQTPNVTSPSVLGALKEALARGVLVKILTSERLMVLEQLVTAGTTTSRCMQDLVNYHKRLLIRPHDEEAGLTKTGRLLVMYYVPDSGPANGFNGGTEPVQSHLKMTIVDRKTIVFGSGNMDRASWYTSQELGVAFFSEEPEQGPVARVWPQYCAAVDRRRKVVYDSSKTL